MRFCLSKSTVMVNLQALKMGSRSEAETLAISISRRKEGLIPVGPWILQDRDLIEKLADWRWQNRFSFFAQFPRSFEGMYEYLDERIIDDPHRLLFMIASPSMEPIGHVGMVQRTAFQWEVDAVMKSPECRVSGVMHDAIESMMSWARHAFESREFILRVVSTNDRAIALYSRLGFQEVLRYPLMRHEFEGRIDYLVVEPAESNTDWQQVIMRFEAAA